MFLSPVVKQPNAAHRLLDETTGRVLAGKLEGAFDSKARRRGLLGRDGMDGGSALAIAPCNSIHTFFMRFAIDALFVKKGGEVVKVCHSIPAWRIRLAPRAFAVIEMPAGTLRAHGVEVGHVIRVEGGAESPGRH